VRPDLRATETALLSLITGHGEPAPALDAAALVRGDARADAATRLGVYQRMYGARLAEALEAQFPRLARLLGHDGLQALAGAYAAEEPSRQPSLRWLGERLPDWLARRRTEAPWLAGLARLEWARSDVFDAPDEPVLAADVVGALPPDAFATLPLALVAAHRLITVGHAASRLWDAADDDATDGGGGGHGPGETLLVWRQGTAVFHRAVDAAEHEALALVAAGTTFGALCDAALGRLPVEEATGTAFAWLTTWLADGLLAAAAR
jgi:hypothetical protein